MKRLLLLAITLYIMGPICVNCYWAEVVDRITTVRTILTDDEKLEVASLYGGGHEHKCAKAKADAQANGVVLGNARLPNLPIMGKYEITTSVCSSHVMGFLVHDNPPVVLTNNLQVYAQRNANAAGGAGSSSARVAA